jgi:hypothetical protein
MNSLPIFALASIFLMVGSDCREREKPKKKWDHTDGGIVLRPECDTPSANCHFACIKRNASLACTQCCRDYDYLCNTGHPHDYSLCDGSR